MYKVELYARVRRACMVEGMSTREAARVFGLHRDTVREMLQYSVPPGYRRESPPRRPKLDPYRGVIDRILEDDRSLPKKQRHTAKRIYERLRAEHGFTGKYTIVKDYVRERRRRTREMYVPLSHPAGDAQCDFGQAKAVIGGVEQTVHYFVLDLPHSDACFVKAYPAETKTERRGWAKWTPIFWAQCRQVGFRHWLRRSAKVEVLFSSTWVIDGKSQATSLIQLGLTPKRLRSN